MQGLKSYILVSDASTVEEYRKVFFQRHPRAKKFPIETPLHPSMNKWIKLPKFSQDNLKQAWKEYTVWLVEKHGFTGAGVDDCIGICTFYRPTKRRFDCDNVSPKFVLDGIVEAGMLVDDDRDHLNPLVVFGEYDKNNTRMEIVFIVKTQEVYDRNPILCYRTSH